MGRRREPKPRHGTVTYYELEGRRVRKGTPGAVKRTAKTDTYYLFLPSAIKGGSRRAFPLGTTDLAVAWVRLRAKLEELHREELGISDDSTRQAGRPIAEHLAEWLAVVAAGEVSEKQVETMRGRMERLVETAGWNRITDIKKSSCQSALAKLQKEGFKKKGAARGRTSGRGSQGRGKGVSAQTRNHYLSHARQFAAWLHDEGRLKADPLAGMRRVNVATDRRHDRRVPDELEVRVLFDHLQCLDPPAPARCGMTGPQRALGYMVSMCSGLRAGELRRLRPDSFDLTAGDVHVTAKSDKVRKRRVLALPRWLCSKVAGWLDGGGELWASFPEVFPGKLLQDDLAAARSAWLAEGGVGDEARKERRESSVCVYEVTSQDGPLYFDFHALRHFYITHAAATDGISPSTLLAMSRHSDPKMTLDVYAKAKREGVRKATELLPRLDGGGAEEG